MYARNITCSAVVSHQEYATESDKIELMHLYFATQYISGIQNLFLINFYSTLEVYLSDLVTYMYGLRDWLGNYIFV